MSAWDAFWAGFAVGGIASMVALALMLRPMVAKRWAELNDSLDGGRTDG